LVFDKNDGIGDFNAFLRTQKLIITSRLVLNRALKDPKVAELDIIKSELEPADWLEKKLVVDFPAPEIISISLKGEVAEELVNIVNAVTNAYVEEEFEKEKSRRMKSADRLAKLKDDYDEKLHTARTQYKTLAKQAGLADPKNANYKYRLLLDELAAAKIDLAQARSARYKLEVEYAQYQQGKKQDNKKAPPTAEEPIPEALIDVELRKVPDYQAMVSKRDTLKAQIKKTADLIDTPDHIEKFTGSDKKHLRELEAGLASRRKELQTQLEKEIRARLAANTQSIANATQRRLQVQKDLEERLSSVVKSLTDETKDLSDSSIDLRDYETRINQFDEYLSKVAKEAEAVRVELDEPARVTILDPPLAQRSYDIKKQILAGGITGLAAFAIGVLGVGWREYRARKIKSGEEVVNMLGMRLVGALPALPEEQTREQPKDEQIEDKSGGGSYHHNQLVEHIDAARARLLHAARVNPFRTLMITSAGSGEGKTSLASHLAASLARAGRRTLLLDCDLRRPSAHVLFDLPSAPGMSEVLRGELELHEGIQQTFLPNLSLLPGGKWNSQASQVLAQEEYMRGMFARLKEQYDFIIIDSSPILAVSDGLWLAQYVDAAVFAILYEVSHIPSVQAAYHELTSLGTRILGAVIGGTPVQNAYGYQYAQYSARYYGNPG
jgi:capsular exopolysaccharide synthesis family protein